MSEKKGQHLSEWEWSAILHTDPDQIRKRFREELTHLYSVGTMLDAIRSDQLLSHVLAYAWRDTYRLALVCKRFKGITRGRQYWGALARHALKGKIHASILEQVNFFHGLEDSDPPHTFLHVLLSKVRGVIVWEDIVPPASRLTFYGLRRPEIGNNVYCLDLQYVNDKSHSLANYYAVHYGGEAVAHHPVRRTYFNHPKQRKLVYFTRQGVKKDMYLIRYVEVFCLAKGKTWCGESGTSFSMELREDDVYPNAESMGYWK